MGQHLRIVGILADHTEAPFETAGAGMVNLQVSSFEVPLHAVDETSVAEVAVAFVAAVAAAEAVASAVVAAAFVDTAIAVVAVAGFAAWAPVQVTLAAELQLLLEAQLAGFEALVKIVR